MAVTVALPLVPPKQLTSCASVMLAEKGGGRPKGCRTYPRAKIGLAPPLAIRGDRLELGTGHEELATSRPAVLRSVCASIVLGLWFVGDPPPFTGTIVLCSIV